MTFAIVLVGWIFSLCLHEFFHALAAYMGGDYTVKDKGYLTFNPLRYTHPLYSIVLPLVFLLMGGIGLPGGAVYIETWRLKTRSWQSVVSLAGPAANLLVAIILAIVLAFAPADALDKNSPWPGIAFLAFLQLSALVLNLIPLPPFDGYGILEPFLSDETRFKVNSVRLYITMFVFFALWRIPIFTDLLWGQVGNLTYLFRLPFDLIQAGYDRFLFWQL